VVGVIDGDTVVVLDASQERHAKGKSPTLGDIKPFALRATEQAARIAGVLAAFHGANLA
jgi:hypothetical protein